MFVYLLVLLTRVFYYQENKTLTCFCLFRSIPGELCHEYPLFISAHLCSPVYATAQSVRRENPGVPIGWKPLGKHESAS